MQDNMIHNHAYAFGYLKSSMSMVAHNLHAKGLIAEENIEAVDKFIREEIVKTIEAESKFSKEYSEK